MDNSLSSILHFPTLVAPYDRALHAAVTYVLERYEQLGIIDFYLHFFDGINRICLRSQFG